ncbi:MAG: biotin transporter BioY [Coriobacteriales bacterium]|jgi:biotin transport system substrate-specific component|nr:biotin transporter BioY [Coriobacteriales bacterium]
MRTSRTRSITLCGLAIALLAVGAFITVPLGPVPFTLQTMMLLIVILVLSPGESLAAVGGYLLLGAFGLPIGAGFKGGIAWLLGPTGGFLLGFFVAAVLVAGLRWLLARPMRGGGRPQTLAGSLALSVAAALILMLTNYSCGVLWFSVVTNTDIWTALVACVFPFALPDALKAVAAIACVQPILAALGRAPWTAPQSVAPQPSASDNDR